MADKVAIVETVTENILIKRAIEKKFSQECEILPYLIKGLNLICSTKFLLLVINEDLSGLESSKEIAKKQASILNGIKMIRDNSANKNTPILITFNSMDCPSPLNNRSYQENLDLYREAGASMCLSLQDNFNQKLVRSLNNYL